VYPNLIKGGEIVQINLSEAAKSSTELNVISSEGKLLRQETIPPGTQSFLLDTNLNAGVYFLIIVQNGKAPLVKKLIVQ